jgi:hypothetical protein
LEQIKKRRKNKRGEGVDGKGLIQFGTGELYINFESIPLFVYKKAMFLAEFRIHFIYQF